MMCKRCGRPIKPGQAYVVRLEEHVACPTPRQIAQERLWERANAYLGGYRYRRE